MSLSNEGKKQKIEELKTLIHQRSISRYLNEYFSSQYELKTYSKVKEISNYKDINRIKVELDKDIATLYTEDGEVITIPGKNLMVDGISDDLTALFLEIRCAINAERLVNIFNKDGITNVMIADDDNLDKISEIYNKIIKTTNGKIPCKRGGEISIDSFQEILPFIRIYDLKAYESIKRYFTANKKAPTDLFNIVKTAQKNDSQFKFIKS